MKKDVRARFQKQLLELEKALVKKAPRAIEPNRTDETQVGTSEDEQPLNEMVQAIASNRNRSDALMAARIARALKKLKDEPDEYGLCEECGEEIPAARLKAMPFAEFCVGCQSLKDVPKSGPTRRKLTDYSD